MVSGDFNLDLAEALLKKIQQKPHKYVNMMLDVPSNPEKIPEHLKDFLNPPYSSAILYNNKFIEYFSKITLFDATQRLRQESPAPFEKQQFYDEILRGVWPMEHYLEPFYGELLSRFCNDIKNQLPKEGEELKSIDELFKPFNIPNFKPPVGEASENINLDRSKD